MEIPLTADGKTVKPGDKIYRFRWFGLKLFLRRFRPKSKTWEEQQKEELDKIFDRFGRNLAKDIVDYFFEGGKDENS